MRPGGGRRQEALLLSSVAFGPLAFGCVEPWSLALLQTSLFAMLLPAQPRPIEAGPTARALLPGVAVILFLGLVQCLNASPADAPRSLLPSTHSTFLTRKALVLWAAYGCLLWQAGATFISEPSRERFAWTLFLIGCAVAVIGILQLSQGNALVYGFRLVRYGRSPFGPYFNRGHAASLMAMSALLGGGIFLSRFFENGGRRRRGARADLWATQALMLFLMGILGYALLLTRNRGSLLGMSVAAWMLALLAAGRASRPQARWGLRGALLLGPILAGWILWNFPQLTSRLGSSSVSVPYRLSMYSSAWTMFLDTPVWGVGLGSLIAAFHPYKAPLVQGVVDHLHNDWLELLVQTGLAGCLPLAAGLLWLGVRAIRLWQGCPSARQRCLFAGGLAAAICFLVHGLVEFSFQIPANAVIFLALLSWLGQAATPAIGPSTVPTTFFPSTLQRAVLAVTAAGMVLASVRPPVAAFFAGRAEAAPQESRVYYRLRAYAWHNDPQYLYQAGVDYLRLSEAKPEARLPLLRLGLDYSSRALALDRTNPQFRALVAAILRRLHKTDDARAFHE